jgi:hypothetical protein
MIWPLLLHVPMPASLEREECIGFHAGSENAVVTPYLARRLDDPRVAADHPVKAARARATS